MRREIRFKNYPRWNVILLARSMLLRDVEIPELYVGDVVYVKNIGAYSSASAVANFNGFAPAKIVMV